MNKEQLDKIVDYVFVHGKAFNLSWTDEGSVDTGPMAREEKGLRLGCLKLAKVQNGSIFLSWGEPYEPKSGSRLVYSSMSGKYDDPNRVRFDEVWHDRWTLQNWGPDPMGAWYGRNE